LVNAQALAATGAVTVNAPASINLGANETFGSLSGTGTVAMNSRTLSIGSTNNLSSTFSGALTDGTGTNSVLVKAGTGTLTLGGSNTSTGATTASAGSLLVNGSLSVTSPVSVATGATLGGSGTVGNVSSLAGQSGIVNPGSPAPGPDGTLTVSNFVLGSG